MVLAQYLLWVVVIVGLVSSFASCFNGDLTETECPDECDCHYFRVNLVTDCSESNLTQIPYEEISPDVYILDLNGNHIKNVEPFPSDIKLRRLQLADNLITEVRHDSFANLNHIIDADFAGNRIRIIDPHTFENKTGFLTLELQDNELDPINGPFLYSNTLLYIDISNCNLNYLNAQFFANISSLHSLDLSSNPLGTLKGQEFIPLRDLNTLKMNHCQLTYIHSNTFEMQSNLKSLELSGNQFSRQTKWELVMHPLVRLEYVDFRNASLIVDDLPPSTFAFNIYMRTLILAENNLGKFDVAATIGERLAHLEILDLSHCHLSEPLSEDAFAHANKLRSLDLSGNTLFASDLLLALAPLIKLQKLSLSQCGLSVLPDTFHKFRSLIELDISHNPLNDVFVKLLVPLERLEYLNMGYSNLSYISPTTFTKMSSMKRLVLSGNDLNSLESGLFANLTHLESLALNSCGLSKPFNATVFFNNLTYTDLTELQLAGNPLRVSPEGPLLPKQLSRLLVLDLSNCNLTFLPVDAFLYTTKITHLILFGNQLTANDGDLRFLQLLPKLQVLDLRFNKLSTFAPFDLSANTDINKLKLVGNPWVCDCWVNGLWNWALAQPSKLSILEGATIDNQDITVGKTKRKRLLICHYDERKSPQRVITSKKGNRGLSVLAASALNRTWAKYVKESGCPGSNALARQRPKRDSNPYKVETTEEKLINEANHVLNTWGINFVYSSFLYICSLASVFVFYLIFHHFICRKNREFKNN